MKAAVVSREPTTAPSLLPGHRSWRLVWNDEFDGKSLDRSKWAVRTHMMGLRHPGMCGEEALEFRGDSYVRFKRIRRGDLVCSCQLQTGYNYLDEPGEDFCFGDKSATPFRWPLARLHEPKFEHRYGYYEIRCRLQRHPYWWSAFWLQSPVIGSSLHPESAGVEVDIMESFRPDGTFECNNHWNGYGPDHQHAGRVSQLEASADGFHHFGVEWTADGYTYYADGREVWRCSAPVSRISQFILVTTECAGYRKAPGPLPELLDPELPEDEFIVDFVRVYDALE